MKINRVFAIVMVFCLCLGLCACGSKSAEKNAVPTQPRTEKAKITKDNFDRYFYIETETRNYVSEKTSLFGTSRETATADCCVTIGNRREFIYSNVTITLEITSSTYCWEEKTQTVTLHIPVQGSATKTVPFESDATLPGFLDKPVFYAKIVSITGTVEYYK